MADTGVSLPIALFAVESWSAADLNEALLDLDAVSEAFPMPAGTEDTYQPPIRNNLAKLEACKTSVAQRVERMSPEQWRQAVSRATNRVFYTSAYIAVEKQNGMKVRRQAASALAKLIRDGVAPTKPALYFLWSLVQYSNEPWLRVFAIKNFALLFQMTIRPFIFGNGLLEFPLHKNLWEEKLFSKTILALKRVIADPKEDKTLKRTALGLLKQLKKMVKPNGFLSHRLTDKVASRLPGINPQEFCYTITGLDRYELRKMSKDKLLGSFLPLSTDHLYAIFCDFKIRTDRLERNGVVDVKYNWRFFDQVEEAYQRKNKARFFEGLVEIVKSIAQQ